jgi:hypothetical protein
MFASPSTGSGQHVLGLQLAGLIGVKLEHVWFKGAADAMNALLGNSVPSTILTLGELTNLHQAGKARILATFTKTRTADLPDVPTFTELGYPAMQADGAVAMFGPAGMDPALTERISKAVRDALDDPNVRARILKMGMEPKAAHHKSSPPTTAPRWRAGATWSRPRGMCRSEGLDWDFCADGIFHGGHRLWSVGPLCLRIAAGQIALPQFGFDPEKDPGDAS